MELQQYLFDRFEPACLAIMQTMQKVAFVILTLGLILAIYKARGFTVEGLISPLLTCGVLTSFIAAWPELVGSSGYVWKTTSELAGQIEADAWTAYMDIFEKNQDTWWDWMVLPRAAVTAGIVAAVGMLGQIVMYLARAFQFFMIGMVLAFGPVFLSLYTFSNTRPIAVRFLTGTLAIFLWDVAWKLVDLGTLNLARLSSANFGTTPASMLLIAGWVILGYAFAPVVVSKALVAGGSVGGALLGGVAAGGSRVAAAVMAAKYAPAALAAGGIPPMPPPPPPVSGSPSGDLPAPPPSAAPVPSAQQSYSAIKAKLKRS